MQSITRKVWSHRSLLTEEKYYVADVRRDDALDISDYPSLVKAIAKVSFHNPELSLFFRGQSEDYRLKTNETTLRPSIYRQWRSHKARKRLMKKRFENLEVATRLLRGAFDKHNLKSKKRVFQFEEVAWSILQHYEVVPTPMLDLTHSLRVAASFALRGKGSHGFIFVLGLPFPDGSISYYSEKGMVNLRLLSICPPEALRPYFQDGYLSGSFPHRVLKGYTGKLDFGHRLIAKFRLQKNSFWSDEYPCIPDSALYPEIDQIKEICHNLGRNI